MITQRRQNICESCGFWLTHGSCASSSIQKIINGSLQPKLKGASVWPLMHAVKCLQAESVICHHCTGSVKNRSVSTAVISGPVFTCPGRAGPGRFLGLTHYCYCCSLHCTPTITWPVYYRLGISNILKLSRNLEELYSCKNKETFMVSVPNQISFTVEAYKSTRLIMTIVVQWFCCYCCRLNNQNCVINVTVKWGTKWRTKHGKSQDKQMSFN